MNCPFCQHSVTQVFNSRKTRQGTNVWRRRRCVDCKQVFTSYEAPQLDFIRIEDTLGTPLPYSKARLYSDVYLAFRGHELGDAINIDNITQTIELKLMRLRKDTLSRDEVILIVAKSIQPLSITSVMRYLADHPPTDKKLAKALIK